MRMLLILLSCCLAFAGDPWTRGDIIRESVYTGLIVLDWRQTLDIHNHPGAYEQNSMLGMHPSRQRINNHFLTLALLHPAIAAILPRPYRQAFQYLYIGIETGTVGHNVAFGLHVKI